MSDEKKNPRTYSEAEWKTLLSPEQYRVTRLKGTERPFTGEYYHNDETGVYHCVCCDVPLFSSTNKFDSGSGWPSFWEALDPERVELATDVSHGMDRIEARCKNCGAHLGHLFDDGPKPTGKRYCINSVSLKFKKTK